MGKSPRPINSMVLISGSITSGIALMLVYLLNQVEFNPMGFYFLYLVPVGALLVGLLAGSGYAVGSRLTNVRVRGRMLQIIFLAGVVTFFAAHYITYREALAEAGVSAEQARFVDYLQWICENMVYDQYLIDQHNEAWELGPLGYGFKALECVGFAFGGLIPLLVLKAVPYCDVCQFYRRKVACGVLNSEEQRDLLKRKKAKEREVIIGEVLASMSERTGKLLDSMRNGPLGRNLDLMQGLPQKADKQSIARVRVDLMKCPGCDRHSVIAMLANQTVDGQENTPELDRIDVEQ